MLNHPRVSNKRTLYQTTAEAIMKIFREINSNSTINGSNSFNESQITERIIEVLNQNAYPQAAAASSQIQSMLRPDFNLPMKLNGHSNKGSVASLYKNERQKYELKGFNSELDFNYQQNVVKPPKKRIKQQLNQSCISLRCQMDFSQELIMEDQSLGIHFSQKKGQIIKNQRPGLKFHTNMPQNKNTGKQQNSDGSREDDEVSSWGCDPRKSRRIDDNSHSLRKIKGRSISLDLQRPQVLNLKQAIKEQQSKSVSDEIQIKKNQLNHSIPQKAGSQSFDYDQSISGVEGKHFLNCKKKLIDTEALKNRIENSKAVHANRKPKYPEMEQQLENWIITINQYRHLPVNALQISKVAKELLGNIPGFRATKGWVQNYLIRHPKVLNLIELKNEEFIKGLKRNLLELRKEYKSRLSLRLEKKQQQF